ncbi:MULTISPECIES: DegV family protein [Caproicibacterium]|uniref:DegV family protein n=1 Tax=Caproicibacterium argilliputei TaxID=3030016 RepID=A0AA97DA78_9FIRM|nr:DegV family protein [Caproicibacterium argilliputei]WOC32159.1 DegV family protein [Caproicibacterium argilliputei]
MSDFVILTDSSCDLPAELAQALHVTVLPLTFRLNGKEYKNLLDGSNLSFEEFYLHIRSGVPCTTNAVNVEDFKAAIELILQSGKDVLCVCFSSGLSATYNAAKIACEELAPQYPQRQLRAVDTLAASLGQGLLVYYAAQKQKKGESLQAVADWLEENKLHLCHWFTVDDLQHLKRGGRISSATALFGTMLGIKPVMHMDNDGHLVNVSKARGRRAALDALVDHMEQTALQPQQQVVFISHADSRADAEYVAQQIKERIGVKEVLINYVGPVIGAHAGPGTIALFFLGTER